MTSEIGREHLRLVTRLAFPHRGAAGDASVWI